MTKITIGHRARLLREQAGMSQQTLAERAGVSFAAVRGLESLETEPRGSVAIACRLASALGVTLTELFGQ